MSDELICLQAQRLRNICRMKGFNRRSRPNTQLQVSQYLWDTPTSARDVLLTPELLDWEVFRLEGEELRLLRLIGYCHVLL